MKKVICLALAVLLCASLAFTAMAADGFVPSVTYQGHPEVVETADNGITLYVNGEAVETVDPSCLVIVPVAEAEASEKLSQEAKDELLKVYQELSDGTMVLPYAEGVDVEKMAVRELFDISLGCAHDHATKLTEDGVAIGFTLDLGVAASDIVIAMAYVNGAWVPAEEVTVNANGSVELVFEDLCPIAIAVQG